MYYFAYGSNLNQKQMKERCPDSKPLFTSVLPNYKLVFVGWSRQWRGGVASIKSFRGERVRGAIYEVTEACLQRLDRYESGYNRLKVTVVGEDDEPIGAITYAKAGRLEDATPSKEYLAIIQQGLRDWRLF
ncbi:MAG: gamma-glutamylcyclotransferase family protein [Chloroflexota bacterium]|nr:gamma-glutamylcyclotransferase [Chloroflexota bacterium]